MRVRTTSDPEVFAGNAGDWLADRPADNNLLLSHAYDPAGQLPGDGEPTFAWVTDDEGATVGAAWTMTPYRATVSAMPDAAVDALVPELARLGVTPPGVNGPASTAKRFGEQWAAATGRPARHVRDQWLIRVDKGENVRPPAPSGTPRAPRPEEAETIAEGFAASMRDSGLPLEKILRHTRHMVETQMAAGRLVAWDDGGLVGASGWARPLSGVARPSGFFIRPEHQRSGYAGALLAEVTARALEDGGQSCVTTHFVEYAAMRAVWEKVGYRPVLDITEYRFD